MSGSVVPGHFDDRLATVLMSQPESAREKAAVWRQVLDMLAQSGPQLAQDDAARGLAALSVLKPHVPAGIRLEAARSIASRCRFAPLAVLLGNDEPSIAVALFDRISLGNEDWLAILPALSPLARSRLRARTDMPLPVRRALDSLGSVDFSLPPAEIAQPVDDGKQDAVETGSNIAELVERIEAYRRRPATPANDLTVEARNSASVSPEDRHDILVDEQGWLRAVAGLPRAAFVGLQFGAPAMAGEAGVDAAVARLFVKRGDIRGGRLQLNGNGPWSGCWLIDADAQFDDNTGRFTGYVGTIAFGADALPEAGADPVEAAVPSRPVADGVRQMAHELRSPLNAINGFAQLIEGQYFGPVSGQYRGLAASIIADAQRLGQMIDDLDMAAKFDTGAIGKGEGVSDIAQMLKGFEGDCGTVGTSGDVELRVTGADAPIEVEVPRRDLHQLLLRLIALSASDSASCGTIEAHVSCASDGNASVSLTCADPSGQGNEFGIRLIQRMAEVHGGSLTFIDGKAFLSLPCAKNSAGRFELIR